MIKIATDAGTHEGEGAKISTSILPGEIQKLHRPAVLGAIILGGHVSYLMGFLLLLGRSPLYPITVTVLKR